MRVDEWIIPAPAEAVAIQALMWGLPLLTDNAGVSTQYPHDGGRHVRVTVAGGDTPNLVTDRPTLIFECWDFDEIGAETLANRVAAVLRRSPGHVFADHFVRGWEVASRPQNHPDPDTRMYRYQLTGAMSIRPSITQ